MKSNEFILYGLSEHRQVIDRIIAELNAFEYSFDIRLILTEALTNAFKHGNKMNVDKPIYLRYLCDNSSVRFEVEDSGSGLENLIINKEISEENLLDDQGRGLFLIKNLSDNIEMKENILVIQKSLLV